MCSPSGLFVRTGKLARNEPMSSAKKDAILSTKGVVAEQATVDLIVYCVKMLFLYHDNLAKKT